MNLKKKVMLLDAVSAMAVSSVAGAAGIGLVNMAQAIHNYPGYGALELKMKQVDAKYQPQYEKQMAAVQKLADAGDKTGAKAQYDSKVAPIMKQYEGEITTLQTPMMKDIFDRVEAIRVQKGLDVVLSSPQAILAAPQGTKIENVTKDLVDGYKK